MNIAGLYPQYFQAILDGSKNIEYRVRKRPDRRLDDIEPGEYVTFFECGSNRVMLCEIIATERIWHVELPVEYRIHLGERTLVECYVKHSQGWRRIRTSRS